MVTSLAPTRNDPVRGDNAIVPAGEKYPTAQVPGAMTVDEVVAAWREAGAEPELLTKRETLQKINIVHDPIEGVLSWDISRNMDGLFATLTAFEALVKLPELLIGDTAMSICEYFTKGAGRAALGTSEAAIMVVFQDGQMGLKIIKGNRLAAKKLLATAVVSLLAEDGGHIVPELLKVISENK